MEILFILIFISIMLAAGSVVACLAAIRGGQYDDLESPRWRMLFDDRRAPGGRDASGQNARPPEADGTGHGNMLKRDVHTSAQAQRSNPL
jgi:cbb3-type cytochrome oxidase maturation protein